MNKKILKHLIYRICKLAYLSNEGHVPSALSVLDIVWVIYSDIININLIKKKSSKDRFQCYFSSWMPSSICCDGRKKIL